MTMLKQRNSQNLKDYHSLIDYPKKPYSQSFVNAVPIGLARRIPMLAFQDLGGKDESKIELAICNSAGLKQLDNMRRFLRASIKVVCSTEDEILSHINRAFEQKNTQTDQIISSIRHDGDGGLESLVLSEDLLETEGRAPIIKLVNSALFDAVKQRASDVHFQPYEDHLVIRFRIDGVLFDVFKVPKKSQEEVLSRMKVIGK